MRLDDKIGFFQIADDELLQVSGGTSLQDGFGNEVKEGRFITSALSNYASGELPKYAVGSIVKIKWHIHSSLTVPCSCEVVGISETRTAGLFFRKFTYSVRIHSCPNSDLIGTIETDVHENCLSL